MRVVLLFLFACLSWLQLNAQNGIFIPPDYAAIKEDVQNASSEFYYPNLMARLLEYDTTLSMQDYRHLYYGYIYDKKYEPYWHSDNEKELLKYYRSDTVMANEYDKIIRLATESINSFPFDLRSMNYMAYIYHLKGDNVMANKVSLRFQGTLRAILSTGDGETCETGFHVISTSHEYVFLNMFRFRFESQSLTGNCDYMKVAEDERKIKGIYFNIEKLFTINRERYDKKK